jgi:hypothetical protein
MEKIPEKITEAKLDCIIMPSGEIICNGFTIGWFSQIGKYLIEKK